MKLAKQGLHPEVVYEFPDAYVVLGSAQFYKGYCVLVYKHHVRELHDLTKKASQTFWNETQLVGRAIADLFKPWKMNYENLGNQVGHLHWHVFPRYRSDALKKEPVWLRPAAQREKTLPEVVRKRILLHIQREIRRLHR